jgi:hypothetical protein
MNGILAGVTVALKQSVPETELKILMLGVKVKVSFVSIKINFTFSLVDPDILNDYISSTYHQSWCYAVSLYG